jgi:hypothetical protein
VGSDVLGNLGDDGGPTDLFLNDRFVKMVATDLPAWLHQAGALVHVRAVASALGHESFKTTAESYAKREAVAGAQQKRALAVLTGGKLVKKRAYGYRSFRNYRLRLLNACA